MVFVCFVVQTCRAGGRHHGGSGHDAGAPLRFRSGLRRLADVGRHPRSQHGVEHEGVAGGVGRQDEEKREMDGRARVAELRQSRGCGRHGLRRHQQRAAARSEAGRRSRRADGVPRVGRRVPVAADAREARLGARQRLALPGRRLVGAGGGHAHLLHQQSRRRLVPRHQRVPRRQERRPGDRRKADRTERRRRHLVVRHDGGSRFLPAQHVEFVAGDSRRSAVCQHLERPGREPRAHPLAARAGDHRAEQEHRQAGMGRQLGRGSDSARAVVDAVGGKNRRSGPGGERPGRRLGARL